MGRAGSQDKLDEPSRKSDKIDDPADLCERLLPAARLRQETALANDVGLMCWFNENVR